jgi:hypothetical protein
MTRSIFHRIHCSKIHAALIGVPAVIGLVSMVGLSLHVPILTSWAEDRVTMKISTSFGMLGLSYLLFSKHLGDHRNEIHAALFVILLMAIGFMGYRHPSDQVETVGTFVPSLGTALGFGLMAATTLRDSVWIYRGLRLLAGVALVGHAFDYAPAYYYLPTISTGMAIPTASAFFLASFFRP